MPQRWNDATDKYSEDTLRAHGILLWHIQSMYYKLVKAMEEGKSNRVLYLAADLGHYIADAHVPLHTTLNYNGGLTHQHGIHAFWESRLPELFANDYHYCVGTATYQSNVLQTAWEAIVYSHAAKDSVLLLEQELSKHFPSDQKYAYESKGQSTVKVYSLGYATAYHKSLNGMVERQMQICYRYTDNPIEKFIPLFLVVLSVVLSPKSKIIGCSTSCSITLVSVLSM